MIPLIAAATLWPVVWANNYCVYRGNYDLTHEEAVVKASNASTGGGEPTEEAWKHVNNNTTWCLEFEKPLPPIETDATPDIEPDQES